MARHWLTKQQKTVVGIGVAIAGVVAMSASAYAHTRQSAPAPAPTPDTGPEPVSSPDQIPDQASTPAGEILVSQYAVQNGQCYRVDFTATGSSHTPVDMSLCQSTPDITP